MNTKNLLIASAIGAVVTAALAAIPGVACLVCLPFWGGPLLAAWIYKRQNGTMTMNQALGVGALTGVFAAVLSFIVSLAIGPASAAAMASALQRILPAGSVPPEAFATGGASVLSLLIGIVVDVVFGVIGGLIGGSLFKDKPATPAPPVA